MRLRHAESDSKRCAQCEPAGLACGEVSSGCRLWDRRRRDRQPLRFHKPRLAWTRPALRRAVESINRRLEQSVNNLRFSVDDDTGKVVVKVLDTATDQVIRQIPSEEALAISRSLEKLQGLLLNQQA